MVESGEQLVLARMPKRLFACTPSRLAAFDCPRRYRMTYLDRPQPARGPAWAHNSVGAVVHLALALWFAREPAGREPAQAGELVRRNWSANGFRDDAQSAQWRDLAAGWVQRYLTGHPQPAVPIGIERTVAAPTAALAVSGRVDRIDEREGELVVVDYKTGRSELSDDDARGSQALALYAVATERTLRRRCRQVELHHLPSGTVLRAEHTDESLQRHVTRAEATAADIQAATDTLAAGADADDVFPAVPSSLCSWCDFRQHCAVGRAAAPARRPWDGLAEVGDANG